MDFRLGSEADAFRGIVREFLDEHLTDEIRERAHETGTVHDWDFHRALGERGWIAASWPVEYGGQGRSPYELTAMREELRLAGAPTDGLGNTLIVARTINHLGSPELKEELLPRVLRGEMIFALGYSEPDAGSDAAAAKTRAVRDGDEWVINGQKMFTTLAHEAAYVLLLARTDPDVAKHQGLTMFLVPLDAAGVEITPVHTLGGERTNVTYYTDVRVPDRLRVGDVDHGWEVATVALAFERGGMGLTESDRMWRQTVEWASTTERAGAPVIDDPLVRDRLARVAIANEVAKLLAYRVSWVVASGGVPSIEGSMHKLFYAERFQTAVAELMDMLGPEAVLAHGADDAPVDGWVEHQYRHAPVTTIYGGTSEVMRNIIAQRGLGLPRA
ncbi:MAG: acyl-CoA dehydrogenase [Actinobacteria bacterium]|nr:acyl-CoA dehydrogenase [Actinomycetota bacterium]